MSDKPNSDIHQKFKEKGTSKFLEPCKEESINSMKCLDKYNYDKGKCKDLFVLYRECKKKWLEERRELRRKGSL
ncbi:4864_t:CDS:2 [Funneliformis caledonium]|uniref:Cytochrome c oxidase-assembly factor COX23, mitochondrial n=2 Tax=Funneliformis TaxID=1117308 RepID=A0A9N9D709_9GLOM|nr:2499_t:CDS:2 [Funneliformis mosseae]CAG8629239.1 4864_t:CDS:2 [Funneliformis caledonium]